MIQYVFVNLKHFVWKTTSPSKWIVSRFCNASSSKGHRPCMWALIPLLVVGEILCHIQSKGRYPWESAARVCVQVYRVHFALFALTNRIFLLRTWSFRAFYLAPNSEVARLKSITKNFMWENLKKSHHAFSRMLQDMAMSEPTSWFISTWVFTCGSYLTLPSFLWNFYCEPCDRKISTWRHTQSAF